MKTIVEKVKRGHPPRSSKPQETVAKSSLKIQAKVSKSSSKTKPVLKDNNEDNDNSDDRQYNDIYTLDYDTYYNDNEEFQL
ncbi:19914_t:CDS:2, partial [Dentiscutata erythropus]